MKLKFPCKDCGHVNEAEVDIDGNLHNQIVAVAKKAAEDIPVGAIRWFMLAIMFVSLSIVGGCWITKHYSNDMVRDTIRSFADDPKVKRIILEPKRTDDGDPIRYEITTEPKEK
ncbi:MAG: hypothetical protein ACRER2_00905 [Methylococcales bacterium]